MNEVKSHMEARKCRFLVNVWHWPSIPLKYYHYCWRCLYCLMQGSWHLILLLYGKPVGLTAVPGCALMLLLQKSWSVRVTVCTPGTSWSSQSNSLFRSSPVKSRFLNTSDKAERWHGEGRRVFYFLLHWLSQSMWEPNYTFQHDSEEYGEMSWYDFLITCYIACLFLKLSYWRQGITGLLVKRLSSY